MTATNGRTFTQAQLNSYLAQERRRVEARYADYDDMKARVDQFDALLATASAGDDSHTTGTEDERGSGSAHTPAVVSAPNDAEDDALAASVAPKGDSQGNSSEASHQDGTLEADNQSLKTQLLRQQISAKAHLDPDLWDRVTGSTADEIAADVATLVGKFGAHTSRPPRSLQSGASVRDFSTPKERAVAALRGMGRA